MLCCHYLNVHLSISLTRSFFWHFMKHENKRWPLLLTGHDISKSRRCTCGRRYIWSTMQQCLQRTWGWGGGDGFRCIKLIRRAGKLMIMEMTAMFFYRIQFRSLPCLVTESVRALVEFCFNWICQSCFMVFSKMLDVFVKVGVWMNCYMDLSKLIHVFL